VYLHRKDIKRWWHGRGGGRERKGEGELEVGADESIIRRIV
jgi:hypothetical protein